MALKYTWGGIIRGTAAEKSTVPSSIPLNTLYVETDTNILYRYTGSSTWATIASGGGSTNLDSLTDVIISSPATGALLRYNGTNWIVLNKGTAGQYLKTNSTATDVAWEDDAIALYTDDLLDVVSTTPGRGQMLRHDGSNYVNKDNTFFQEKTGNWMAISDTVGEGLLQTGLTKQGDATADIENTTYGHGKRFAIAATTTAFGLKQTVSFYRRQWNSRLIARVAFPSSSSNCRGYVGFLAQSTDLANTDDLLNAVSGVVVGIRHDTLDANLKVLHNDGTGATVVDDTGIARSNSSIYNIEIVTSSTDVKVYIGVDTTLPVLTNTITTELPSTSAFLYPHLMSIRSGGGTKNFDIWKFFVGTV